MPSINDTLGLGQKAVVGLEAIGKRMEGLRKGLRSNIARRALYQGAKVIGEEARRLAPKRTGALKKAIYWYTDKKKASPNEIKVSISVRKQAFGVLPTKKGGFKLSKRKYGKGERSYQRGDIYPRNYAHLVEFGTKAHRIQAKRGGSLSTPSGPRQSVNHPGSTAKPFFRPAYKNKLEAAKKAIETKALQEVETELLKLGAKK